MTHAWCEEYKPTESTAWSVAWAIHAPWAHSMWSWYLLELCDLTVDLGKPPILYLPGATHEFLLYALHPDHPLKQGVPLNDQGIVSLMPPNYGYQIRAESNEAARKRLQAVVDEIVAERLSPDTDWRGRWDRMFSDGYPMVRSRMAEALGAPPDAAKH